MDLRGESGGSERDPHVQAARKCFASQPGANKIGRLVATASQTPSDIAHLLEKTQKNTNNYFSVQFGSNQSA